MFLPLAFAAVLISANTAAPSPFVVDDESLGGVRMTVAAGRSLGLCAPTVLCVTYRFKMRRVHACAIAAQVVKFEPRRDRPVAQLEGHNVGSHHPSSVLELSVTEPIAGRCPEPASLGCSVHLVPEALHNNSLSHGLDDSTLWRFKDWDLALAILQRRPEGNR